ncbi:hypothetical protein [uncultured Mediterranean phage]|nr:hypothetical protein [uncultured Mediterranean phage]
MTASAGAWYRVGKVNVTVGSQSVTGVGTNWQNDVISIAIGDIFTTDAKTWYEVTAVNSDTSITLDRDFEGNTANGENYAIVRNSSGTILTRIAGQVSVQFNQKQLFIDELRTWLNSDNASEELTDSHGVKQSLKTPSQMVRDHDDKLAELDAIHPYPWAMRKVEFEAIRAANNEKYAASGFVHFGKHYDNGSTELKVAEGLYVRTDTRNNLRLGRESSSLQGLSKTNHPVINMAGVITEVEYLSRSDLIFNQIKLPSAEDGTRTYDSATGVSVVHATPAIAFASETTTNKVVTSRVDMWGFERFLREISNSDPFVYRRGAIQSDSFDINGIPTVSDNVRPITYFAWYDGDTASRGKGVNWQTATESQRIAIASDPKNNIYFDDATGKFYQWCIRGRSIAGIGNGDWDGLDSAKNTVALRFDNNARVSIQGQSDTPHGAKGLVDSSKYHYYGSNSVTNLTYHKVGLFRPYSNNMASFGGVNGECYFLVCGTINRLNQGAYHPGLNPLGSKKVNNTATNSTGGLWYQSSALTPLTSLECFMPIYDATTNTTDVGVVVSSGELSSPSPARPDSRFHDVIYVSGEGGVCRDMRYSAGGVTLEDFAEQDTSIKRGTYRGTEFLAFTKPYDLGFISPDSSSGSYPTLSYTVDALYNNIKELEDGDHYYVYNKSTGEIFDSRTVNLFVTSSTRRHLYYPTAWGSNVDIAVVYTARTKTPVSHTFTLKEVLGHPTDLLNCNDLKEGWSGIWNPTIPSGQTTKVDWTRPILEDPLSGDILLTDDLGVTWSSGTSSAWLESTVSNRTTSLLLNEGRIVMYDYKTKALVVKPSDNSNIYGGRLGVGEVFASSRSRDETARSLGFSLIKKVLKSQNNSGDGTDQQYLNIKKLQFGDGLDKLLGQSALLSEHDPIQLAAPLNNSPAFKALNYNVVENQQAFINYAYTELKHNGTDWGDDGKIHIADNQTQILDENGYAVFVGMAQCVEPLGWMKNDK